jgi:hypothetical protein
MKLTTENRSTRGKTCPSAILSTINPIWTDPGSNSCLRGERRLYLNFKIRVFTFCRTIRLFSSYYVCMVTGQKHPTLK